MFNIGPAELLVIGLVLLIAVGPEQLPGVIRRVGSTVAQFRSMTDGLRSEFMAGLDEIERATDVKRWTGETTGAVPNAPKPGDGEASKPDEDDDEDDVAPDEDDVAPAEDDVAAEEDDAAGGEDDREGPAAASGAADAATASTVDADGPAANGSHGAIGPVGESPSGEPEEESA